MISKLEAREGEMFYEEKIIGGLLYCRTSPDGEWQSASSQHAAVVNELLSMKAEQRADVFRLFCTHCGSTDPRCQCWNDE